MKTTASVRVVSFFFALLIATFVHSASAAGTMVVARLTPVAPAVTVVASVTTVTTPTPHASWAHVELKLELLGLKIEQATRKANQSPEELISFVHGLVAESMEAADLVQASSLDEERRGQLMQFLTGVTAKFAANEASLRAQVANVRNEQKALQLKVQAEKGEVTDLRTKLETAKTQQAGTQQHISFSK